MNPVANLRAVELRRLLDRREISAVELTRYYLEQINERNSSFNCFLSVENEHALSAANAADRKLRSGDDHDGMLGIPLAIKDIFEREEFEVSAGSRPWMFTSRTTATVIDKLHGAGAIILGTLNLDEFAAGGTGANMHFGRCINPRNPGYLTGGSSSGSAAAVGAGLTPLSLGSDAGGSIRIPAAYCGVTGLKPTYGRVSRYGAVPRTWSMDCIGPLARTAADCALLLDTIAGIDANDATSSDKPACYLNVINRELEGLTLSTDHKLLSQCHSSNIGAIHCVRGILNGLGAQFLETDFADISLLNDMQQVIVKSEGATFLGPKLRQAPHLVSEETRAVIQEGFLIPATSYIEALSIRGSLLQRFINEVMGPAQLLLLPVTPDLTPSHQDDGVDLGSDQAQFIQCAEIDRQFTDSARFTRFANYLGLPAIAFPVASDDNGLPVSVQLIGRPWSETILLNVTHHIQRCLNQ